VVGETDGDDAEVAGVAGAAEISKSECCCSSMGPLTAVLSKVNDDVPVATWIVVAEIGDADNADCVGRGETSEKQKARLE
jgi:hypothetical protein